MKGFIISIIILTISLVVFSSFYDPFGMIKSPSSAIGSLPDIFVSVEFPHRPDSRLRHYPYTTSIVSSIGLKAEFSHTKIPIIFFHGSTGSSSDFDGLITAMRRNGLEKSYTIFVVDTKLEGSGYSANINDNQAVYIDAIISEIIYYICQLPYDGSSPSYHRLASDRTTCQPTIALGGHSMGGVAIQRFLGGVYLPMIRQFAPNNDINTFTFPTRAPYRVVSAVTFSSPVVLHPFPVDFSYKWLYDSIQRDMKTLQNSPHRVLFVAFGGGSEDGVVEARSTDIRTYLYSSESSIPENQRSPASIDTTVVNEGIRKVTTPAEKMMSCVNGDECIQFINDDLDGTGTISSFFIHAPGLQHHSEIRPSHFGILGEPSWLLGAFSTILEKVVLMLAAEKSAKSTSASSSIALFNNENILDHIETRQDRITSLPNRGYFSLAYRMLEFYTTPSVFNAPRFNNATFCYPSSGYFYSDAQLYTNEQNIFMARCGMSSSFDSDDPPSDVSSCTPNWEISQHFELNDDESDFYNKFFIRYHTWLKLNYANYPSTSNYYDYNANMAVYSQPVGSIDPVSQCRFRMDVPFLPTSSFANIFDQTLLAAVTESTVSAGDDLFSTTSPVELTQQAITAHAPAGGFPSLNVSHFLSISPLYPVPELHAVTQASLLLIPVIKPIALARIYSLNAFDRKSWYTEYPPPDSSPVLTSQSASCLSTLNDASITNVALMSLNPSASHPFDLLSSTTMKASHPNLSSYSPSNSSTIIELGQTTSLRDNELSLFCMPAVDNTANVATYKHRVCSTDGTESANCNALPRGWSPTLAVTVWASREPPAISYAVSCVVTTTNTRVHAWVGADPNSIAFVSQLPRSLQDQSAGTFSTAEPITELFIRASRELMATKSYGPSQTNGIVPVCDSIVSMAYVSNGLNVSMKGAKIRAVLLPRGVWGDVGLIGMYIPKTSNLIWGLPVQRLTLIDEDPVSTSFSLNQRPQMFRSWRVGEVNSLDASFDIMASISQKVQLSLKTGVSAETAATWRKSLLTALTAAHVNQQFHQDGRVIEDLTRMEIMQLIMHGSRLMPPAVALITWDYEESFSKNGGSCSSSIYDLPYDPDQLEPSGWTIDFDTRCFLDGYSPNYESALNSDRPSGVSLSYGLRSFGSYPINSPENDFVQRYGVGWPSYVTSSLNIYFAEGPSTPLGMIFGQVRPNPVLFGIFDGPIFDDSVKFEELGTTDMVPAINSLFTSYVSSNPFDASLENILVVTTSMRYHSIFSLRYSLPLACCGVMSSVLMMILYFYSRTDERKALYYTSVAPPDVFKNRQSAATNYDKDIDSQEHDHDIFHIDNKPGLHTDQNSVREKTVLNLQPPGGASLNNAVEGSVSTSPQYLEDQSGILYDQIKAAHKSHLNSIEKHNKVKTNPAPLWRRNYKRHRILSWETLPSSFASSWGISLILYLQMPTLNTSKIREGDEMSPNSKYRSNPNEKLNILERFWRSLVFHWSAMVISPLWSVTWCWSSIIGSSSPSNSGSFETYNSYSNSRTNQTFVGAGFSSRVPATNDSSVIQETRKEHSLETASYSQRRGEGGEAQLHHQSHICTRIGIAFLLPFMLITKLLWWVALIIVCTRGRLLLTEILKVLCVISPYNIRRYTKEKYRDSISVRGFFVVNHSNRLQHPIQSDHYNNSAHVDEAIVIDNGIDENFYKNNETKQFEHEMNVNYNLQGAVLNNSITTVSKSSGVLDTDFKSLNLINNSNDNSYNVLSGNAKHHHHDIGNNNSNTLGNFTDIDDSHLDHDPSHIPQSTHNSVRLALHKKPFNYNELPSDSPRSNQNIRVEQNHSSPSISSENSQSIDEMNDTNSGVDFVRDSNQCKKRSAFTPSVQIESSTNPNALYEIQRGIELKNSTHFDIPNSNDVKVNEIWNFSNYHSLSSSSSNWSDVPAVSDDDDGVIEHTEFDNNNHSSTNQTNKKNSFEGYISIFNGRFNLCKRIHCIKFTRSCLRFFRANISPIIFLGLVLIIGFVVYPILTISPSVSTGLQRFATFVTGDTIGIENLDAAKEYFSVVDFLAVSPIVPVSQEKLISYLGIDLYDSMIGYSGDEVVIIDTESDSVTRTIVDGSTTEQQTSEISRYFWPSVMQSSVNPYGRAVDASLIPFLVFSVITSFIGLLALCLCIPCSAGLVNNLYSELYPYDFKGCDIKFLARKISQIHELQLQQKVDSQELIIEADNMNKVVPLSIVNPQVIYGANSFSDNHQVISTLFTTTHRNGSEQNYIGAPSRNMENEEDVNVTDYFETEVEGIPHSSSVSKIETNGFVVANPGRSRILLTDTDDDEVIIHETETDHQFNHVASPQVNAANRLLGGVTQSRHPSPSSKSSNSSNKQQHIRNSHSTSSDSFARSASMNPIDAQRIMFTDSYEARPAVEDKLKNFISDEPSHSQHFSTKNYETVRTLNPPSTNTDNAIKGEFSRFISPFTTSLSACSSSCSRWLRGYWHWYKYEGHELYAITRLISIIVRIGVFLFSAQLYLFVVVIRYLVFDLPRSFLSDMPAIALRLPIGASVIIPSSIRHRFLNFRTACTLELGVIFLVLLPGITRFLPFLSTLFSTIIQPNLDQASMFMRPAQSFSASTGELHVDWESEYKQDPSYLASVEKDYKSYVSGAASFLAQWFFLGGGGGYLWMRGLAHDALDVPSWNGAKKVLSDARSNSIIDGFLVLLAPLICLQLIRLLRFRAKRRLLSSLSRHLAARRVEKSISDKYLDQFDHKYKHSMPDFAFRIGNYRHSRPYYPSEMQNLVRMTPIERILSTGDLHCVQVDLEGLYEEDILTSNLYLRLISRILFLLGIVGTLLFTFGLTARLGIFLSFMNGGVVTSLNLPAVWDELCFRKFDRFAIGWTCISTSISSFLKSYYYSKKPNTS